jgi:Kef-type K+ transport system membrane component KefB
MHELEILLTFAGGLAGALVLGFIAHLLKLSPIVGYLLAGVLVGPFTPGFVADRAVAEQFAEIGVILLLFEVGLETDLAELARVGAPALVVAVAGMALPFLGGVGLTLAAGYPPITAIFVGAALTATSIGITARVLSELSVLRTREGQIILGAAIVDDVLGLVVLAVVTQIAEKGGVAVGQAVRAAGFSIGFLAVALALGIPLGKRLVGVVGRANVRGVLVAASVAFALLIAFAAEKAGSAPIVGAFAAGVALARTNRRHDIDTAVKPAVDLFAPVFFVAVGAQVDVKLLDPFAVDNRPALLLAAGLTVVGFLGKFLAGFCAWGKIRRAFVGAGMVPRGEVGLIFASMGRATGAFEPRVFVAVVIAVFATTFLAPPLLKALAPKKG